jgi:hypothetical protein
MASLNHGASGWFIVKRNWPGIMQDYLGLGGDCYPGTEAAGGNYPTLTSAIITAFSLLQMSSNSLVPIL